LGVRQKPNFQKEIGFMLFFEKFKHVLENIIIVLAKPLFNKKKFRWLLLFCGKGTK